jgi:hypothetical protein
MDSQPEDGTCGTRPATDPEANCFHPYSGEVKDAWSYTSTSSCMSLYLCSATRLTVLYICFLCSLTLQSAVVTVRTICSNIESPCILSTECITINSDHYR